MNPMFRMLLAGAALLGGTQALAAPDHVDITWMSITNMYFDLGNSKILADGYITRLPPEIFYSGLRPGFYRLVATLAANDGTTTPYHDVTSFQILERPGHEIADCVGGKVSSAEAAAYSCEVLQMPQMRGAITSASPGSRFARICSKPRNIVPTHQASVTSCPASSSRTSMSPSTRLSSIRIVRRSDAIACPPCVGAQALAGAGGRCLNSAFGNGNFGPMQP